MLQKLRRRAGLILIDSARIEIQPGPGLFKELGLPIQKTFRIDVFVQVSQEKAECW